jgi:hypothetical protein
MLKSYHVKHENSCRSDYLQVYHRKGKDFFLTLFLWVVMGGSDK